MQVVLNLIQVVIHLIQKVINLIQVVINLTQVVINLIQEVVNTELILLCAKQHGRGTSPFTLTSYLVTHFGQPATVSPTVNSLSSAALHGSRTSRLLHNLVSQLVTLRLNCSCYLLAGFVWL